MGKRKVLTQKEIVLKHLEEHGKITSLEAFQEYLITRLSAIIYRLRREGYDITSSERTSKRGSYYAEYKLREHKR